MRRGISSPTAIASRILAAGIMCMAVGAADGSATPWLAVVTRKRASRAGDLGAVKARAAKVVVTVVAKAEESSCDAG